MSCSTRVRSVLPVISCAWLLSGCEQEVAPPAEESTPPEVVQEAPERDARPNFLLITTDDMGYTDLGAFGGHEIPTPNLDELAMAGIRLTNFRTNLSCAPTRSMLMSGTGNHEAGMGSQQAFPEFQGQYGYEKHIADRVVTLPERLQALGYHTYMAGKWHLGDVQGATLPRDRGFERSFALVAGGFDHFRVPPDAEIPRLGTDLGVPYAEDGQLLDDLPADFYSTTVYVDKLISYLESSEADDQPFFAWFSPTAPHWPLQAHPEWKDRFAGVYDAGYDALCRERQEGARQAGVLPAGADFSRCPEDATAWEELSVDDRAVNRRVMEIYAAMVAHLDTEFGRIIAYLEESGQLENTYIIYHNDNGPDPTEIFTHRAPLSRTNNELANIGNPGSWVAVGQGWTDAGSSPFRDDKGSHYEGGIRVPAYIVPPNSTASGQTSSSLLTVMDIMPTILELAGVDAADMNPTETDKLPMRGTSFAALLKNPDQQIHDPNEDIPFDHAGWSVLLRGDWKIVRTVQATEWQLFNTAEDPSETQDISAEHPDIFADMVSKYEEHAAATGILRRTTFN